ncbi:hypothetical protein FQA39_LY05037 [Lamprigera yunnana]|nr:hypothetical protein FQA39_LY05037 [Lamprigera yunnana]
MKYDLNMHDMIFIVTMEEDDARTMLEMYDNVPEIDGAICRGFTIPGIQKQAAATPSGSRSPASFTSSNTFSISRQSSSFKKPIEVFAKMQNELRSFLEITRWRWLRAHDQHGDIRIFSDNSGAPLWDFSEALALRLLLSEAILFCCSHSGFCFASPIPPGTQFPGGHGSAVAIGLLQL